ncbi:hypothetical protein [Actinomadura sp. RB99]|uniref:hypothetical protein n=1 Tax=Actinomadura sp. RB99 TaxID=2691577 RepID=UPI0016895368|nr:hypothetical protein [Actinomadura sp. RB99]
MELIYTPLIVVFAVFVIYGGLVIPVREIVESIRDRRSRGPSDRGEPGPDAGSDAGAGSASGGVIELRSAGERRRAAA